MDRIFSPRLPMYARAPTRGSDRTSHGRRAPAGMGPPSVGCCWVLEASPALRLYPSLVFAARASLVSRECRAPRRTLPLVVYVEKSRLARESLAFLRILLFVMANFTPQISLSEI
eukprot:3439027-Prymnesium_polylepis.1